MNTIGIIAEFNPFHNGHLHLIDECKKALNADRCVVIMSGDFVQRGAPAIMDKFTRAKMALNCGVDVVLELPVYYALSSAEYFARGAVSVLDKLGCIDYLCFGSECGDLALLTDAARILNDEPDCFKDTLEKELKKGQSFASAREKALGACFENGDNTSSFSSVLSDPNNILAVEYIKALLARNSKIKPYTIKRKGEGYHSEELSEFASASAIRDYIFKSTEPDFSNKMTLTIQNNTDGLKDFGDMIPCEANGLLSSYEGSFASCNALSDLLHYKLLAEKRNGFTRYLDVSEDLSNKIVAALDSFSSFDDFCLLLKSKDIAYSRISRALCHILLNISCENMVAYKADDYTSYARILGMRKASSDIVKAMKETSTVPVIGNLKEVNKAGFSDLQKRLFDETLLSSEIYFKVFINASLNEFRLPLIIV
jgi:predicted nucleotidyltransferase